MENENVSYAVFLSGKDYYVGWMTKNHRCCRYGPFKTEDQAERVLCRVTIEKEFSDWLFPVPPVSTANWDIDSWRKWITKTGIKK